MHPAATFAAALAWAPLPPATLERTEVAAEKAYLGIMPRGLP
jgi:hypothetical protein